MNRMNHTPAYVFLAEAGPHLPTPGGIEGWVGQDTTAASNQSAQDRFVANIAFARCSNRHDSLGRWIQAASPQSLRENLVVRRRTATYWVTYTRYNTVIDTSPLLDRANGPIAVRFLAILSVRMSVGLSDWRKRFKMSKSLSNDWVIYAVCSCLFMPYFVPVS